MDPVFLIVDVEDPLTLWTLLTGHCPECGAVAEELPDGLMHLVHAPDCAVALRPIAGDER